MKTTIYLLIALFFIVYSSKPTITIKPFSIEFESPYTPFAFFFLTISLALFQLQSRIDAKNETFKEYYTKGFKEGSEFTVEEIKKQP